MRSPAYILAPVATFACKYQIALSEERTNQNPQKATEDSEALLAIIIWSTSNQQSSKGSSDCLENLCSQPKRNLVKRDLFEKKGP
jgi:hypothetical protein